MLVLIILARRWRIVTWWAAGAAGLYLAGAAVLGWSWVQGWLEQVSSFNEVNIEVNGFLMVSAVGWFQNLLEAPASLLLAAAVIAVAFGAAAVVWWRRGLTTVSMAIAAPIIVIVAPSALYYDAALGMVAFGAALDDGVGIAIAVTVRILEEALVAVLVHVDVFTIDQRVAIVVQAIADLGGTGMYGVVAVVAVLSALDPAFPRRRA